jgi:hypothetical protein
VSEFLTHVPGGATQDPFKILDRPFYAAEGFLDGAGEKALWGRAAKVDDVEILSVREVTAAEVAALPPSTRSGASSTAFKAVERLKPRHHEIARALAGGLKETELCEMLSMSLSHLHRLKRSPAFQHLLAYYMAERDVSAMSMRERLEQASSLALDRVQERLEDEDNPLPVGQLKEITFGLLDRAGYNPTTKIVSASAQLSAQDLAKLKEIRDAARSAALGLPILEADQAPGEPDLSQASASPTLMGARLEVQRTEGERPRMGAQVLEAPPQRTQDQLDLFRDGLESRAVVRLL